MHCRTRPYANDTVCYADVRTLSSASLKRKIHDSRLSCKSYRYYGLIHQASINKPEKDTERERETKEISLEIVEIVFRNGDVIAKDRIK